MMFTKLIKQLNITIKELEEAWKHVGISPATIDNIKLLHTLQISKYNLSDLKTTLEKFK